MSLELRVLKFIDEVGPVWRRPENNKWAVSIEELRIDYSEWHRILIILKYQGLLEKSSVKWGGRTRTAYRISDQGKELIKELENGI